MQWPEKKMLGCHRRRDFPRGGGLSTVSDCTMGTKIGAEAWSLRQATGTSREQLAAVVATYARWPRVEE